jgi:hypothetical protein
MKQFIAILFAVCTIGGGNQLLGQCNVPTSTINENFDAILDTRRPPCWTAHNTNTANGSGNFVHLHEYWMWKYAPAGPAEMFMVVLPYSTVKGPVSFDLKKYPNGGYLDFEVGTLSNPNDPNTFSLFQTIPHNSDVALPCTVNFANYTGSNGYIAFRCYIAPNQGFSFDNLTFTGPSSSIKPVKTVAP